ncbi:MAG: NAD(P)-dependent oxidoreductase [Verrucomicrobiaceae bacterium]|nr:NAD(P)-dependent oxidoreductase [Verrucomicrobiaceae bacterium]
MIETHPHPASPSIGIIGMGLMGSSVMQMTSADRGWDIDQTRCVNASTAADVFANSHIIFLCLPNSQIVRSVMNSARLRPGQIIIDTSTGAPDEVAALAAEIAGRDAHSLDATISGSSAQLLQQDVLVMVGGDETVFEQCRWLFEKFASDVVHVGPSGSGAKLKLVTNLVLGINRAALAEGLALAQQLDLDLNQTLDVMRRSMAYSRIMDTKGSKMIAQDFTPQAKLAQHLKDVNLMLAAGDLPLPMTEAHRALLERAIALGFGDEDNSAIFKAIIHP